MEAAGKPIQRVDTSPGAAAVADGSTGSTSTAQPPVTPDHPRDAASRPDNCSSGSSGASSTSGSASAGGAAEGGEDKKAAAAQSLLAAIQAVKAAGAKKV